MWLIKELFVGKAHESVIVIISCIISYFQQCISFALWTGWWSSFKFNVQLFLHINKGISNWTLIHFPWCYGWRTYFVNPSILWRFYMLGLSECRSNDTILSSPPSLSAGGNRFSKKKMLLGEWVIFLCLRGWNDDKNLPWERFSCGGIARVKMSTFNFFDFKMQFPVIWTP